MRVSSIKSTLFVLLLCGMSFGHMAAQNERTVYVTAESSKSGFLADLKSENFRLFENKVEREILSVTTDEPMSVGFVFDVSGSVLGWGDDLNDAAASIFQIVDNPSETGEYFLMGFNRESTLLTDWTSTSRDIEIGLNKLPSLQSSKSNGATVLYQTCLKALEKLNQGKYKKKVLILLTDGADNSMRPNPGEVVKMAKASDALIYFIAIAESEEWSLGEQSTRSYTLPDVKAEDFVHALTSISGGKLYRAYSSMPRKRPIVSDDKVQPRIKNAFELLFKELHSQYSVKYSTPQSALVSGNRKMDIKLSPKDIGTGKGVITLRYRGK